jgi:hypothetical protein
VIEFKIEAIILAGFEPLRGLILFDILKYSNKRTFSNIRTYSGIWTLESKNLSITEKVLLVNGMF